MGLVLAEEFTVVVEVFAGFVVGKALPSILQGARGKDPGHKRTMPRLSSV